MPNDRHLLFKTVYGLAAAVALFTGFGNMPLYGRYYVADLPLLAWSGNFFINVNVHILAGSLLLAMAVFTAAARISGGRKGERLTLSGKTRALLLFLALATGILMVVKNLSGVHYPQPLLMIFNFTHMGAAVFFMIAALIALIFRQPWQRME